MMSVALVRATFRNHCGNCGGEIAKGDTYAIVRVPGLRSHMVRCKHCAPPPTTTPTAAPTRDTAAGLDFTRIGLLPLDFSKRED